MSGSSDDDDADVSVVCGDDATADETDVGSVSYVVGEANVPVVSDTNVVCCVDVTSVEGEVNVSFVSDTNVVRCIDVTSVSCSSDDDDADVSVVCGADSAADGTDVGSVSYFDGGVNVSVVPDTNVVCCAVVTSATVSSDFGVADSSVVCGGDATADGTDVDSVSSVDGEANVPVVSDANVVCCVDVTSVNGLSDVGEADVSVV